MIYADHAATTKLSQEALEAMMPYLLSEYGNPSTLYSHARNPQKAISESRSKIADIIGCEENEIFFTSCGSESDNWALKGQAFLFPQQKKHIITSCIEHHAILHTCAFLETLGYEVTYLPVDSKGLISIKDLEKSIKENTIIVSLMTANNEIGTIEPIKELVSIAHKYGILFHTDAVQAVGHIDIDVKKLGVDLLSASGHKFNGPKGIGFLYIRNGVNLVNFMHGGSQEAGMRAGTENVASIVGMAKALEINAKELQKNTIYLNRLSELLLTQLDDMGIFYHVNGSAYRIPGSLSLSFPRYDGEMILHRLDLMGIEVTTGSACNSKETVVSHVLKAIGLSEEMARGTIRITLGKDNSEEDIFCIANALKKIVG